MNIPKYFIFTSFLLVLCSGCSTYRTHQEPTRDEPNPVQSTGDGDVSTPNNAVKHFLETARRQFRNYQLSAAEETVNRGLNVAPENPFLWHLLAKIRFLQKKYVESETLASRSISYTRDNPELTEQNWYLIGHARKNHGDKAGAQEAWEKIDKPEGQ